MMEFPEVSGAVTAPLRHGPLQIAIVGGTGFLGRHIVKHLADAGYTLRVIARHAPEAVHLKPLGVPGQITLIPADITQPKTLSAALHGVDIVINLVGILFERGRQQFSAIHAQGAESLAKIARQQGVTQFISVSAIGVDKSVNAKYARTKATGEKAIRGAFPEATILRPSILFGPEDNFFNQFARLGAISPALPLIGGGHTKFQPVFAGDVARAVLAVIRRPDTAGKTYELGGPEVMTFRDVLETIARITGNTPCLIPLPFDLAMAGALLTEWIPTPPLTRDQVRLLKSDNVVTPGALGFADLGIQPTHPDLVLPSYLERFARRRGK